MSSERRPAREVAYRVFAAEYEDATYSHKESEEERAPNYVVTPSGARVNRLFLVGVLTELERVGDDDVLRARVVDPTGAFVVYAGQYQPEPLAVLEDTDPPSFVAVTGKANTFTPDGSDRTFSSIRPESVTAVDADTRDRWVVSAAEHTIDRIAIMADALDRAERGDDLQDALAAEGVPTYLASGIPRALDAYGTGTAYLGALRELSVNAARQVAGEIDEVPRFAVDPDDPSGTEVALDREAGRIGRVPVGGDAAETGTGVSDAAKPSKTASTPTDSPTAPDTAAEDTSDAEPALADQETTDEGDAGPPSTQISEETTGEDDSTAEPSATAATDDEPATEEELYELDEEEREAVESEYGVEFTSGTEIPEAGETEIETPAAETETSDEAPGETSEPEPAATEESTASEDDDLEDVVIERMQDIGGGEGVKRSALIDDVTSGEDIDADAVAEAIQSALMSGRCYESGEDELTPI